MNMKKISLYATLLAAVTMTACTDYVGEIEEAHDEYVNSHTPKVETYSSGCWCNVNMGNLLDVGGQYYYNTASNQPNITFALVGCSLTSTIDKVSREAGAYDNLFIESYNVYQSEGIYWADFALNSTAQQGLLGGSLYTVLDVYNAGMVDHVSCPTVSFGYKNTENSDNSDFTNTSSTTPTFYYENPSCGDLWCGLTDIEGRVETGSEEESAGYWYAYTDASDDGTSSMSYPPEVEENAYGNFFGPLTEAYGGIKATVTLGAGYDYPYAGLAFNVVSDSQEGGDISGWDGICLVYKSTLPLAIELGVEDEANVTGYNNYKASLPKETFMAVYDVGWDKFKQESGWGETADRDYVLEHVSTIRLKFSGTAGTTGDFLIQSIGRHGKCN